MRPGASNLSCSIQAAHTLELYPVFQFTQVLLLLAGLIGLAATRSLFPLTLFLGFVNLCLKQFPLAAQLFLLLFESTDNLRLALVLVLACWLLRNYGLI
jgi:hypothetical protein